MHIDFSAVIVSGRRDLPSDARTFIAAKKAHQPRVVKIRSAFYKLLFKSNRVLRTDKKKRCKSNLSTVSVLPNKSLHHDLMHSAAVEQRPQIFVYRLSPFPFPLAAIFLTLSPDRELVHKFKKKASVTNAL